VRTLPRRDLPSSPSFWRRGEGGGEEEEEGRWKRLCSFSWAALVPLFPVPVISLVVCLPSPGIRAWAFSVTAPYDSTCPAMNLWVNLAAFYLPCSMGACVLGLTVNYTTISPLGAVNVAGGAVGKTRLLVSAGSGYCDALFASWNVPAMRGRTISAMPCSAIS